MPAALPSDKSVLSSEEGSPGLQVTGCLGNAAADPDCPMATCLHSTQFQLATGHPGQVSRELTLSALGWQIDEDALQGSIWEGWAHRAPSAVLSCFCLPSCVGLLAWWLEFPLAAVGSQTGETVRVLAACQGESCRKSCSCCPAQTEATSH